MKVKIELLSDTILGSGLSVPGGEDIGVQHDNTGFPYLKGSTLKGILREEMINLWSWQGKSENQIEKKAKEIFGEAGYEEKQNHELIVSDFLLPNEIYDFINAEEDILPLEVFTYIRTFTKLENGIAKDGSLRTARCIRKGIFLFGEIQCAKEDEEDVRETLAMLKWIGSMKTRGFGKVKVTEEAIS